MKKIAIFSLENDIHALAIQKELENRGMFCEIIETNKISDNNILNWSNNLSHACFIPSRDGSKVDIRDFDLIWWRRSGSSQIISKDIQNASHIDLINNDCRDALLGILLNEFNGIWINDPHATRIAENKLVQLKIAQKLGFKVPDTLVSQNVSEIKNFFEKHSDKVIIKPVKGTREIPVYTRFLKKSHLQYEKQMNLCPAMYEEYVSGDTHIRANCFGKNIFSAAIKSDDLDWRKNLDSSFSQVDLPDEIEKRIIKLLNMLGLKMGIIDIKINENNEYVWLEINPQGQFLFVEGLTGMNLTKHFTDFLVNQIKK